MIDMVFLLLVFFMTVSTLAREARPEARLAVSSTARVPEAADPRSILTLLPEAERYQVFWYNRPVGRKELETLLKENDGRELVVRAPADLPWRELRELLGPLRESGLREATFATFEE